ncbi:MAG: rhomboid family intramembrane serine protease, partial [Akkermansiaceae bacterium]|nr:rhomboid family intramembrane serine protease [Akkermansiaceae bacterium]
SLGASGAIAGVMAAYLVLFPRAHVTAIIGFIFIPIPIPAFILIGLWFVGALLERQFGRTRFLVLLFVPAIAANAAIGYGVANWYLTEGNDARAREMMEKLVASSGWAGFGVIAAEADLARLKRLHLSA